MSIDTARSGLHSSLLCIGSFVVMGVLGQFQSAGFLHFCRLFKKPSHPKKSRLAPKKPSHPKKAGTAFWRVVPFRESRAREKCVVSNRSGERVSGTFRILECKIVAHWISRRVVFRLQAGVAENDESQETIGRREE